MNSNISALVEQWQSIGLLYARSSVSEFEPRRRRISFDYMSNRGRTKIKVLSAVVCNITDTTTTEVDNQTTRRGQVRKTTETAEKRLS